MGIFGKRRDLQELDFEELRAAAIKQVEHRRQTQQQREVAVLDAIGAATDPLAQESLRLVDQLPYTEKEEFLKNVFRRLVVQALYTADALDEKHTESLRYSTLHWYGSGRTLTDIGGDLMGAVIKDSLPTFTQEELDLQTENQSIGS